MKLIENTYEQLRKNWFGTIKGLHLDSYKAIKGADSYQISIQDKLQDSDKKNYILSILVVTIKVS